jgi:hypothetical protein
MAIHMPAVQPHRAPAVPNVAPAALALVLFALLGAALMLIKPAATPVDTGVGLNAQRHGEIDAGRTGPHSDYLIYRAGEINAANQ